MNPKKITIMMTKNNAYISVLSIFTSRYGRAHISPKEDWNFPGENC